MALYQALLERLHGAGPLDWSRAALDSASVPAKKGRGDRAEPDRSAARRSITAGKPGTKRHLVVEARGTPLGVTLSDANRHDSTAPAAALDAVPGMRTGRRGPDKLHADTADEVLAGVGLWEGALATGASSEHCHVSRIVPDD